MRSPQSLNVQRSGKSENQPSFLYVLLLAGFVFIAFFGGSRFGALVAPSNFAKRECPKKSDMAGKTVLITGAAGFIGYHTSLELHKLGATVVGIDNFNHYYDVTLKEHRRDLLKQQGIEIVRADLCDKPALKKLFSKFDFTHVLHLAGQAGVRYSLENPEDYVVNNIQCTVSLYEEMKEKDPPPKLVYASSSSVYGANSKVPFSESDEIPVQKSIYAMTKKSIESVARTYHSLYDTRSTGLRFFTVYGTIGRPDMSYYKFSKAIMKGEEIQLYNFGDMRRDFTFVDDIVSGIILSLVHSKDVTSPTVYNLGRGHPRALGDLISILEKELGTKANTKGVPTPGGEVLVTYADISKAKKELCYEPEIDLEAGLARFVEWFKGREGLTSTDEN